MSKPFSQSKPIVVIGSGLAGLLSAVLIAESKPVILLTKEKINGISFHYDQDGPVVDWYNLSSSEFHIKSSLTACRGLCDHEALNFLFKQVHPSIITLNERGIACLEKYSGPYPMGQEGESKSSPPQFSGRIFSKADMKRTLRKLVQESSELSVIDNAHVTEIINEEGFVDGLVYYTDEANRIFLECDQIVLATGGAQQIYPYALNSNSATGEGNILAYSAGAELSDLEFIQLHPFGLKLPGAPCLLIPEAMIAMGGILRNRSGKAIMNGVHPLKDLAPKDIVARTINTEMSESQNEQVFLDTTGINQRILNRQFSAIVNKFLNYNLDIRKDPIPVTPVVLHLVGGVNTDLGGRTTVKGLYAVGEVARTGVHGAEGIAGNTLMESIVFSIQSAHSIFHDQENMPECWVIDTKPELPRRDTRVSIPSRIDKEELQQMMWRDVGLYRNKNSLLKTIDVLKNEPFLFENAFSSDAFESYALKNLARLIALSALQREESRGYHHRSDFPQSSESFLYSIQRTYHRDRLFYV